MLHQFLKGWFGKRGPRPTPQPPTSFGLNLLSILPAFHGQHHHAAVAQRLCGRGLLAAIFLILQFGNACWSFFMPASVTFVSQSPNS